MKLLSTIFLTLGTLLCLTVVLFIPGMVFLGLGALLRIAANFGKRRAA